MAKSKVYFIGDNVYYNEMLLIKEINNPCRLIFPFGERILKIDNWYDKDFNTTSWQCKDEYENWNKIKKTKYAKYFVPTLQHGCTNKRGYYYNIQPKIPITNLTPTEEQTDLLFEIIDFFKFDDLSTKHNISILDSKNFLIYDYSF